MNWWKIAKTGKGVDQVIKHRLRSSPFFVALFQKHNVPLDALDGLSISVAQLDGVYCKASEDQIIIDSDLVKSKELFGPKFHFIAHEILHWLKRQVEKEHYFADPEEVESFNTAIAYFIHDWQEKGQAGTLSEAIKKEFLPFIQITIKNDAAARKFLIKRMKDAKGLLSDMSLCNFS